MQDQTLKIRADIDAQYKWHLEDIFATDSAWEDDFASVQKLSDEMSSLKDTFTKSAQTLYDALEKMAAFKLKIERLFVYAKMHLDENNANATYQGLADRATSLMVQAESAISYVEPAILGIEDSKLKRFYTESKPLEKYRHMIDVIVHAKTHILPKEQEKLLAMTGEMAAAPGNIFTMLNNADMTFPVIKDENGKDVQMTHGNYIPNMESKNRDVRKAAFGAMYETFASFENTIATTLSSSIKKDVFYAKIRKYDSALHSALHADNVSSDVYKNLIAAIHSALPSMHKYMDIKRRKLGVDKLHMYDLYVPIFSTDDDCITYAQSKEMVTRALHPLGDEYVDALKAGIDSNRWIDVYENKGKTSGAYSWGVWDTHPYVLLNWNDTINNAFTLAHELGHAMHSHFSNITQPYVDAQYPILLAEVASTCNEAILMNYMLKNTDDKSKKLYLTNYFLEQFRTTMFRQVMFGEFEMLTHDMCEKGEALTAQAFKTIYRDFNVKYYGDAMVVDDLIDMEWARIPHFYRAFYVYKYATGFASAIALSNMVINGGETEQVRYLNFLKSGGKDFPLALLKEAGIDLTQPDTIGGALKTFTSLVDEMERNL